MGLYRPPGCVSSVGLLGGLSPLRCRYKYTATARWLWADVVPAVAPRQWCGMGWFGGVRFAGGSRGMAPTPLHGREVAPTGELLMAEDRAALAVHFHDAIQHHKPERCVGKRAPPHTRFARQVRPRPVRSQNEIRPEPPESISEPEMRAEPSVRGLVVIDANQHQTTQPGV